MAQDTTRDSPSHTPGTPKGEELKNKKDDLGWNGNTRNSRDATGVNADARGPIDPRMPKMPPA
ncbi:MAG: hypothetical protein NVS9B15_05710 [Acidobacteriaceae bacterium]